MDGLLGLEILGFGHMTGRHRSGSGIRNREEFVVAGGVVRWLLRRDSKTLCSVLVPRC